MIYNTHKKYFLTDEPLYNLYSPSSIEQRLENQSVPSSDLNSILSLINLRSDLTEMVQTELNPTEVKSRRKLNRGLFSKAALGITASYLAAYYVLCKIICCVFYIPQM